MNVVRTGKIITKKQKLILTTTLVTGTAVAVVATLKYRDAIAVAKVAGVMEWLQDLESHGFDVIIGTKEQITAAFESIGEIVSIPVA